jgi:DNA-binding transcriptional LysR family regulator
MDIDTSKITRLDGSLLLVLRELLRQRRTTLVAKRLGLSQSAVSHALSRLRELFDDPLFVREPHGLRPTRHALALAPRVEALLAEMSDVLGMADTFVPERAQRGFRIGAPDHLSTLLAPELLRTFAREAPQARFAFSQRLGQDALDALQRDELDLALGRFASRAPGFVVEPLLEDRYCLIARKRHPRLPSRAAEGKLGAGLYAQLDHVQISVAGDFNTLDIEPVGQRVRARRTVAAVPRFLVAFAVVARSDAVAVAPRRLALAHAAGFGLRVHALPFALPPIRVLAVHRQGADRGVSWLLDAIKRSVET